MGPIAAGKDRSPLGIAAAIILPATRKEWPLLLTYRPPRTTVLLPLPSTSPESAALAVRSGAAPDISVAVIDAGKHRDPETVKVIAELLPGAEVLAVDPRAALRFFWFYRDHHDPLALGHACSRSLLDASFGQRPVPDIRRAHRRRERRNAERDIRLLVREIGAGLGVAPPLPPVAPAENGWSASRLAGLYDACVGLMTILLCRWGSTLALVEDAEEGIRSVRLADVWMRRSERIS